MSTLARPAIAMFVAAGSLFFLAAANTSHAEQIKRPLGTAPGKLAPSSKGVRVPAGAVQLTTSECTSLGGRVDASSKACTDKGNFTCKTVDSQGKEHMACIDRK